MWQAAQYLPLRSARTAITLRPFGGLQNARPGTNPGRPMTLRPSTGTQRQEVPWIRTLDTSHRAPFGCESGY